MSFPLSPARQSRARRTSHEDTDDEPQLLPTASESVNFLSSHRSALLATAVLSWMWFDRVVAPIATRDCHLNLLVSVLGAPVCANAKLKIPEHSGTWKPDIGLALATGDAFMLVADDISLSKHSSNASPPPSRENTGDKEFDFVLACAAVHTLLVCAGFVFGHDLPTISRHEVRETLVTTAVAVFLILCASLWWAWEYRVGPIPPIAESLVGGHEVLFVLGGAATMTVWFLLSMLTPPNITRSSRLHAALMALSVGLCVLDVSAAGCLGCFAAVGAATVLATRLAA